MPRPAKPADDTALRRLLIHYIRDQGGDATIASLLADPIIGPPVPSLAVADLVAEAATRSRKAINGAASKRAPTPGRARRGETETRTAEGRDDYDERVLAAIAAAGCSVAAEQVIERLGGTGLQFRTATKRLLARRKIKRVGNARGTRYIAA